jgi:hypothetical protein
VYCMEVEWGRRLLARSSKRPASPILDDDGTAERQHLVRLGR